MKENISNSNRKVNILKVLLIGIIILLVISILYVGLSVKSEKIDKGQEIATVNGVVIYESDIRNRLNSISPNMQIDLNSLPPEILKALVLEVSVNDKIYKAAKELNYQNDPEILQKVEDYKKELVRDKFLKEQIYSKATEERALEEYNRMVEHLKGKEERKIKHILVSTEEEIERARRSVMRSGNFEKVAKEKSIDTASAENGGDIGYVLQEELVPEFGDIAFILKVGEVSKPVKTQYGWHIIKVEDIRPAEFMPFEDVKDGIIQRLQEQALQEYLLAVTKNANIELKINPGDMVVEIKNIDNNDTENIDNSNASDNVNEDSGNKNTDNKDSEIEIIEGVDNIEEEE